MFLMMNVSSGDAGERSGGTGVSEVMNLCVHVSILWNLMEAIIMIIGQNALLGLALVMIVALRCKGSGVDNVLRI